MNLKRMARITTLAAMITIAAPAIATPLDAATGITNGPGKEGAAAAQSLLTRLHEIKDMDKSTLSTTEKKELRNEVKSIKKELKKNSKGIYLSVGAIIIIILLLILLL
ncbi:MAG: hypothetical protein ABJA57_13295 [Ginsengibacter sp.]